MQDCKPRPTPYEQKLSYNDDAETMSDVRRYTEAVSSFIYITTCARPDLSFDVSKLSQYFKEPTEEQWTMLKHVQYLKGTAEKELCYRRCEKNLRIQAHSDAD